MYTIILILALVIAFFLKGEVSNKVIAVILFVIGILCFEASSFWWRLGFVVLVLCACDSGEKNRKPDSPHIVIALTLVAMSLVKLVATDLFDCYPSWIFNILAFCGSVVYVLNVNNK